MHLAERDHRLHAVAIALLTQDLAVIALIGKHITATLDELAGADLDVLVRTQGEVIVSPC